MRGEAPSPHRVAFQEWALELLRVGEVRNSLTIEQSDERPCFLNALIFIEIWKVQKKKNRLKEEWKCWRDDESCKQSVLHILLIQ